MYALKRTFAFKNRSQVDAFLEVTSFYGKTATFGDVVIFEACLDFSMWRKIINLSRIIMRESVPDIRTLSSKAGLRLFSNSNL